MKETFFIPSLLHFFIPRGQICVDLDGTLIYGHSLFDLTSPLSAFFCAFKKKSWPLFKTCLAEASDVDPHSFYYNPKILTYLRYWHRQSLPLCLVTGAPEKIARAIGEYLGVFSHIWSSSSNLNLVGEKKAAFLEQTYPHGFTYVGNAWKDLYVWEKSLDIVVVSHAPNGLLKHVKDHKKSWQNFYLI